MIGNDTLLGQVATFMETLHLTYSQVLDEIPYRNLIIMSRDKLHVTSGEVWREMTEDEERAFISKKKK